MRQATWGHYPGLIVELARDHVAWSFCTSHADLVDERGTWSFQEVCAGPVAERVRAQLGPEAHAEIVNAIAARKKRKR